MTETTFAYTTETPRLIIRPLVVADYTSWLHGFEARLPAQHRHDVGKIDMTECTYEWFENLVAHHQQLAQADDTYIFAIFDKVDNRHIGMIDFSTLARDAFQWGRIGYTIHNQHWRKGYGKEAVQAALQLAFEQLAYHRIEAHINVDNIPSIRLTEAVGMAFECERKAFIFEHEQWTDHLIYYQNRSY